MNIDSCFVPGTPVHTRDGLVTIEQVQIGDWVLSRPENGGAQAYKRVVRSFSAAAQLVFYVDFFTSDALTWEQRDCVVTTGSHLFWVDGAGWTRADKLLPRNTFLLADGRKARIYNATPLYQTETEGVGW